ncbi:hypothetical protein [Candidatus Magnetomonas plexicatena]|uniref:hypothetical protein n=1 Tax=Candidatus Magnetomonas plexicatena TaxID=2552947 RepID=UPI001C763450|nr:hypothetical protein E2O03_007500 [Nitrospirales bacterium LBB_01]
MKKAGIYLAVMLFAMALVAMAGTGMVSAAGSDNTTTTGGNVYYNLPYLHTNPSGVVYCIVANLSSNNVTSASFTVKASSNSNPTQTALTFPSTVSFSAGSSNMLSFTGKYIYVGSTKVADLSTSLGLTSSSDNTTGGSDNTTGGGKGGSKDNSFSIFSNSGSDNSDKVYYGGTLSFASGSSIDCKKIAMSCFQGTTNPKRPIGGYTCEDDSTTGVAGGKNVLSF